MQSHRRIHGQFSVQEYAILDKVIGGSRENMQIVRALCRLRLKRKGEVFRHLVKFGMTGPFFFELAERNQFNPFAIYKAVIDRIDGPMSAPLTTRDLC